MEKERFIKIYEGTDVRAEGIYEAQLIAKDCMKMLREYLTADLERDEIHDRCAQVMTEKGSEGWWIHNDPALVLFSEMTTFSSRNDPAPLFVGRCVGENDMVTVDVAPTVRGGWGDICRSFFLKDGKVVNVDDTGNAEWIEGMKLEHLLHEEFVKLVNEDTTFADVHAMTERILREHGYHNCDYHGNFGHTIEHDQSERVTIVPDETRSIVRYGKPVTYEPHICKDGGRYGIKHEIMYAFCDGKMTEV